MVRPTCPPQPAPLPPPLKTKDLSDRAIAEKVGVHHSTVNAVRKMSTVGNPTVGGTTSAAAEPEKRKGKDGNRQGCLLVRHSVEKPMKLNEGCLPR